MAPILYMTPLSPPSRAVLLAAQALGVELELHNVDLSKGDNREPEYLKLNPLHCVPTLVDGDLIITDSHAINSYLVSKYGHNNDLYPSDYAKRALVDQRMYFDTGTVFNIFRKAVAPLFYRKSKTISEEDTNKILEIYKVLDIYLEKAKWIAGDTVTIADFSLITTTTALDILVPLESTHFPKTVSWIKNFQQLPYAEVNEPGLATLREVIEKCMK